MNNESAKSIEWSMPSKIDDIANEIHLNITSLFTKVEFIEQRIDQLIGSVPKPEETKKSSSGDGVMGNLKDAVYRLRALNSFFEGQNGRFESIV